MISKEKIKELLTTLKEDLYASQEDSCDSVINSFYNMGINEEAIYCVRNLLSNLLDDTFDLFEEVFKQIDESK